MGSRAAHSSRRERQRSPRRPAVPDVHAIMARLGRAQALITVAQRSLEADDRMDAYPEAVVLKTGLAALDAVYDELDAADRQLYGLWNAPL
ncbi:MAG: hypothetical protein M0038_11615 [Pseudomonadota bacterium]|nr:hypothetical protein [Pseudomonadota bacterium]